MDASIPVVISKYSGNILSSFPEGDEIDEENGFSEGIARRPLGESPGTGVIRGEGQMNLSVDSLNKIRKEFGPGFHVAFGIHQIHSSAMTALVFGKDL
jgi:hypothetical protein